MELSERGGKKREIAISFESSTPVRCSLLYLYLRNVRPLCPFRCFICRSGFTAPDLDPCAAFDGLHLFVIVLTASKTWYFPCTVRHRRRLSFSCCCFLFLFSLFPVLQRTSRRRAGHFRFRGNKGIVRPCRLFVTSATVYPDESLSQQNGLREVWLERHQRWLYTTERLLLMVRARRKGWPEFRFHHISSSSHRYRLRFAWSIKHGTIVAFSFLDWPRCWWITLGNPKVQWC